MTLRQQIIDDAKLGGVFFPTDSNGDATDFNTVGTLYPRGVAADKIEDVRLIVIGDEIPGLEGRYGNHGDGLTINDKSGRGFRETYTIYAPAELALQNPPPPDRPDILLVTIGAANVYVTVKRFLERDEAMQVLHCITCEDVTVRRLEERG